MRKKKLLVSVSDSVCTNWQWNLHSKADGTHSSFTHLRGKFLKIVVICFKNMYNFLFQQYSRRCFMYQSPLKRILWLHYMFFAFVPYRPATLPHCSKHCAIYHQKHHKNITNHLHQKCEIFYSAVMNTVSTVYTTGW